MTREEILAMEPGKELDDHIYELVLGYEKIIQPWGAEEWTFLDPNGLKCYARSGDVFGPSVHIVRAWEVVEKLHAKRFLFDICLSVGAGYTARFYDRDKEIYHVALYIESAPEAIVKAALLSVMEGKDDK